ncbi:unnamed protein product [Sphagnum jensenii]
MNLYKCSKRNNKSKQKIQGLEIFLFVLLAIFVVVLLHYLLDFFFFFKVFRTKAHCFPPGPWPWPVVGNLLQLGKFPHQTLARLAQRYGPLMHLRSGPMHTMVVSSPAMAKEFLKTHDHLFQYRQLFIATEILNDNCSIATSSGAYWRHLRKICLTELFSPKRLQSFQAMRSKELSSTMKSIRIQAGEDKLVDLNFQLTSLTSNIMTQILFRKRYFGVDERGEKKAHQFKEILHELSYWYGTTIIGDYIPSLRWVSKLQGSNASMHALRSRIRQFVQMLLDEHHMRKSAPTTDSELDNDVPKDFMDVLLSMPGEDGTGTLSSDEIEAVVMDLWLGGTDTSSVTIEWAMAELLRNPKIMKCAQTELDNVVGSNHVVDESHLQHLSYLQAIIKETFRLHPAAPVMIPHMSNEACQIEGYSLPPNTRVMVNLWAIGRDPTTWDRPLEFDPVRFLEHPEIDVNGQSFELLPFGSGRRACPGRPLAALVIQSTLASLLHSFDWSLPNQQEPSTLDMSEKFGLTLPRAQRLHIMAHPRLPAHLYL